MKVVCQKRGKFSGRTVNGILVEDKSRRAWRLTSWVKNQGEDYWVEGNQFIDPRYDSHGMLAPALPIGGQPTRKISLETMRVLLNVIARWEKELSNG